MRDHPYRHTESEAVCEPSETRSLFGVYVVAFLAGPVIYLCFDAMLARTTVDNVRSSLFVLASLFGGLVGLRLRMLPAMAVAFAGPLVLLNVYETAIVRESMWDGELLPMLALLSTLVALIVALLRETAAAEPASPKPPPLPIDRVPESQRPLVEAVRRRRARLAR